MKADIMEPQANTLEPDSWFDDLGISKSTFLIPALGCLLAFLQYSQVRQMNQSQQLKISRGWGGDHLRNCASNLFLHQSPKNFSISI